MELASAVKAAGTRILDWAERHPIVVAIGPVSLYLLYRLARDMVPLYFAVPPLPGGALQIVALSSDAGRYVATGERLERGGKIRTVILIAFDRPFSAEGKSISYQTKKEWVDCANTRIEVEGAGFYNAKGEKVLARYFERKPEAAGRLDLEIGLLCNKQTFAVPPVTGYQAAGEQVRALRAAQAGQK